MQIVIDIDEEILEKCRKKNYAVCQTLMYRIINGTPLPKGHGRMNVEEKERLIKKDIESVENRVRHAFNQGYEMGLKESSSEIPNTCGDAISRQAVLNGLANIAKAKARSDAQKALMGRVMFFTEKLPSVNPQKPICPSAGVDCEDCPAYEKTVLESIKYLIEQYEHYLELLDADMKDGSATIVTKTKYAVYTEVVKQLKEVEVQE